MSGSRHTFVLESLALPPPPALAGKRCNVEPEPFAGRALLKEGKMSALTSTAKLVAGGMLTSFALASLTAGAAAQQKASPPDFSSNNAGWLTFYTDFSMVPSGTSPMHDDPAHQRCANMCLSACPRANAGSLNS
jgi:hypothetical protein